jgi:hypothetical protein
MILKTSYNDLKKILLFQVLILLCLNASAQNDIVYLNNSNPKIAWEVKAQADLKADSLKLSDSPYIGKFSNSI